jgi:hypothetical protein
MTEEPNSFVAHEPHTFVINEYKKLIWRLHPNRVSFWPLISGYDCRFGVFKHWLIIIFSHTGNAGTFKFTGVGELGEALIGADSINAANKEAVRNRLEKHYMMQP